MAAKKDKMIPSEKERKRALKYATPAGTGRMWVTMGIAFIIFGIYNIGMNLSNGKLGVNSYSIDTVDVTNEVHKWLADHGYTRVE